VVLCVDLSRLQVDHKELSDLQILCQNLEQALWLHLLLLVVLSDLKRQFLLLLTHLLLSHILELHLLDVAVQVVERQLDLEDHLLNDSLHFQLAHRVLFGLEAEDPVFVAHGELGFN